MILPNFPKIQCPACNAGEFAFVPSGDARCPDCGAAFPVENSILKLLPEPSRNRSLAQFLMEWEPLISVYESPLWRRNPIFAQFIFGTSFEGEFETVVNAARLSDGDAILDLACGPGIYSRPLAKMLKNAGVTGLDLSLPMLNYAASRARNEAIGNFAPVFGNALNLPFPQNQFDAVVCCGAFHLFPDRDRVLSEIIRVLKPGGRFVTAVFFRIIGGDLGEFFANIGWRLHGVYSFQPDELEHKFLQAGLKNIAMHHQRRMWMIMSGEKR